MLKTDMYANFKSGIAFLTTMIQNADARDISGLCTELLDLLDEQIALAERLLAEALEKESELGNIYPTLLRAYNNTHLEKYRQKIFECQKEMDEVDEKVFLYENDLKLLRKQKKRYVFAKYSQAIEALTDEMENLTGSDLSFAIDKQNGLIDDQIPLAEELRKDAIEEGSWKADLFQAELRILHALRNINDELKKRC